VQAVLFGFSASAGQPADDPVQVSAASHSPFAVRQVVVAGANASAGQATAVPLQATAPAPAPPKPRQFLMLPAGLREEELEVQVETEANQYIPFSLDEVSLDFCVIGPSPTSVGDVEVLIAASRKDRVQDRQGLAEAAGLKPAVLDIESHASRLAMSRVVSSLPNEGRDALVALFEIGADTTSLKVLRDDEMLYDRDQAFGGSQLTQLISRQYGFSYEEAEQKKLAADLPDDYETSLLAPFVDSLSQEIGRALQYFFTSTPHHKVHYVMLAGGTATLPGLKERVTDLTGFASMVVNPFEHMKLGGSVRENKVRREAPSYLTACGLASTRASSANTT
jgi:type IV pilus assembly protein PilM